ncbi:hypothetical protein ABG768_017692, partial [Culter alburnus]
IHCKGKGAVPGRIQLELGSGSSCSGGAEEERSAAREGERRLKAQKECDDRERSSREMETAVEMRINVFLKRKAAFLITLTTPALILKL